MQHALLFNHGCQVIENQKCMLTMSSFTFTFAEHACRGKSMQYFTSRLFFFPTKGGFYWLKMERQEDTNTMSRLFLGPAYQTLTRCCVF